MWQWLSRLTALSYLGVIFVAMPLDPDLFPRVDRMMRTPFFLSLIKGATLLMVATGAGMLLAGRIPWRKALSLPLLLVPFVFYVLDHDNPSERVHLLQYFTLGFLLVAAFPRWSGWRVLLPLVLAVFCGWADEELQGYLPNRYFDWEDVRLDAIGAVTGCLQAWFLLRWSGGHPPLKDPLRILSPHFWKSITTL